MDCSSLKCTLVAVFAAAAAGTAYGAQYQCNAADKLSKLGARDSSSVSISGDPNNKECRFSVDGVAAGSPPVERIERARAILQSAKGGFDDEALDALSIMLVTASPQIDAPAELRELLKANRELLSKCSPTSSFTEERRETLKFIKGYAGVCGSSGKGAAIQRGFIQAAVGSNTAWVIIESDKKITYAYFYPGRR